MRQLSVSTLFSGFAATLSKWSGNPVSFALAAAMILVWIMSGPFFGFSSTWQLVINTLTTIVTFLMLFMLQNSQNRDGKALQAKIDELIRSSKAHNKFVGIERLDEDTLEEICASLPDSKAEDGDDGTATRETDLVPSR